MATFGNSTSNQDSESHAERIMISSAVAPSSGAVQSAVARLWLSSDGDVNDDHTDAFFVIYADDNGAPGQLLAVSDTIQVDTFTEQSEHTFTFSGSNQIDIEEGETYWIGPGWRNVNGVFFGRTSGGERREYNFDWDQPPADLTEATPNAVNAGPMYAVVTYEEESAGDPTEVKRLYLSSLPATYRRPASAWVTDDTAATENVRRLTESAAGDPMQYSRPETASNNEPWVLLGMWVSEPLAEPAIVYPEATLCAGMWESSGSANMYPFAVVSITQGDSTGDLRGTTLSHYNNGREFPTTEQAYRFDLDVVDDGAIQAQAGDRIVIQVGYKPENTSSTSYTGTIAFGGTGSPDLDDEDTDLTRPAWIDITFSEGVQFEEPEDTSTPPATAFDLSRWHLTTPADSGDGDAEQIDQPELDSYASEYFFLDEQGRMVFHAPVNGFTTSGASGATRSELREREADYSLSAWDPNTTELRGMTVTLQADATNISGGSNPRQEMIVWQIHGDSGTPPIYAAAEYHVSTPRIRIFGGDPLNGSTGDFRDNPVQGITPDAYITIKCEVEAGEMRLWVIQGQVSDLPATPTYTFATSQFTDVPNWYLKTGAYNKTEIDSGSTGYCETRISHLELIQPGQEPIVYTTRFFLAG